MTVEEIPSDKLVKMTTFWHKAFNIAGCDPQCHCCRNMIKTNQYFKLSTVFITPSDMDCLHWYGDLTELQIKALKGEQIDENDLERLKNDFFFEEKFKEQGGLKGLSKLVSPKTKEVMLCSKCNIEVYTKKQIDILEGRIIKRDKPKGGCFRVNGKIVP